MFGSPFLLSLSAYTCNAGTHDFYPPLSTRPIVVIVVVPPQPVTLCISMDRVGMFKQEYTWICIGYGWICIDIHEHVRILQKIKKKALKKVLRIKHYIRQIVSELESGLFGLVRPSHLPYRAKSEKCSIFYVFLFFPIYHIPPLWVLWETPHSDIDPLKGEEWGGIYAKILNSKTYFQNCFHPSLLSL